MGQREKFGLRRINIKTGAKLEESEKKGRTEMERIRYCVEEKRLGQNNSGVGGKKRRHMERFLDIWIYGNICHGQRCSQSAHFVFYEDCAHCIPYLSSYLDHPALINHQRLIFGFASAFVKPNKNINNVV